MTRIVCDSNGILPLDPDGPLSVSMLVIDVDDATADSLAHGADHRPYRPIAVLRAEAVAVVNTQASAARARVRTAGVGQDDAYGLKLEEARAYRAVLVLGSTPTPADYPMIQAEALATSMTMVALVTSILQEAQAWRQYLINSEAQRRAALVRIAAATAYAEIAAVFPIVWP